MFWNFCAFVGLIVVTWIGIRMILAEIIRAAYWSLWTITPLLRHARAKGKEITLHKILRTIWDYFRGELFGRYQYSRTSSYAYEHAYWPWEQPRQWYPVKSQPKKDNQDEQADL